MSEMTQVKEPPLTPQVASLFNLRERSSLEFWISHILVLLSTVLGVYLAAMAGYRTALDFEIARGQREGYYMRRALLEEVKDNLDQANNYSEFIIEKDGWRFEGNPDAYKFQSYIWDTMKEQSTTFQLPPEVLTAVRRYYDTAASLAQGLARGQGTAIEAAKKLREETDGMRKTALPALERDIAALRARLAAKGIAIE